MALIDNRGNPIYIQGDGGTIGVDPPPDDGLGACACDNIDPGIDAREDWIQWEIPWKKEGEHLNRAKGFAV